MRASWLDTLGPSHGQHGLSALQPTQARRCRFTGADAALRALILTLEVLLCAGRGGERHLQARTQHLLWQRSWLGTLHYIP